MQTTTTNEKSEPQVRSSSFVRPQTFDEIHKIINPASDASEWSPTEKRTITKLVKSGKIKVDDLMIAMELWPGDWTQIRKKEISDLMWPNDGAKPSETRDVNNPKP